MGIDLASLRSDQNRLNANNNDWKEKYVILPQNAGSCTVRIMPPAPGEALYAVSRIHKIDGKNYHSLLTLDRGKWIGNCPLNNEYRRLWSEIEKLQRQGKMDAAAELKLRAGDIRPNERYYFNVIVRKETKENGDVMTDVGPKILSIGKELQSKIINLIVGDADMAGLGDVTDQMTGRDFCIRKKIRKADGKSFPEYSESTFVNPSIAGTDAQWATWLSKLHKLSDERKLKTFAELQEVADIFRGIKPDPELQNAVQSMTRTPIVQKMESYKPPVINRNSHVEDDTDMVDDDFIAELRGV